MNAGALSQIRNKTSPKRVTITTRPGKEAEPRGSEAARQRGKEARRGIFRRRRDLVPEVLDERTAIGLIHRCHRVAQNGRGRLKTRD